MTLFAPVHNHTMYSSLDGLSSPLEIAQRCQCIGCTSAGITDHGTCAGHLEFNKVMRANGVKPIFGVEFYHGVKTEFGKNERDNAHFVAGAMTDEGLKNIWRMVDAASDPSCYRYVGRVNWDILERFSEGVFATSACIQGLVAQRMLCEEDGPVPSYLMGVLDKYLDIYGERFHIEIHTYPGEEHELLNMRLVEVAQERGVPLIYATDAHFACNPGWAPIWMADMSFKSLADVEVGDKVVGWTRPAGKKSSLCESEVLAIHTYENAPLVDVTFESGRTLTCTPNHLWKSMSYGGPAGSEYFVMPEVGRTLAHVVDVPLDWTFLDRAEQFKAAYLGGIFDGEGEGTRNKVGMSQSDKNPAVVERIREYLEDLQFKTWKEHEKRSGYDMNRFFIAGGRSEFVRFANWCRPAQTHKIAASCLNTSWKTPDRIVKVEPRTASTVWGLTTTTGNYVAWGYASKNSPEQYEVHDAYVAMQTGENILMPIEDRKMWHPKSLYIQDEAQIRESLSYLPERVVDEALRNSYDLAERCNADLPEVKRHIPIFVPSECPWVSQTPLTEWSASLLFVELVEGGIKWRYPNASQEIWDKAAYEIEVMLDAGLEHYFLQVWDLCEFCNRNDITRGPGRGSAAGSIISYALGITDVDPLRYDLIFERFWNPGRAKGFPDIDIDFPVGQRKKVRQYLMDRWGHDKVRAIGNTIRMKPKAVLDKTQKACGVTWDEKETLKRIVSSVPDIDIHDSNTVGWAKETDPGKAIYVMEKVGDQIIEWLEEQPASRLDILLRWLDIVEVVCSRPSGYGVHASGVVVSDVTLADQLPCMYNKKQETQVTCFPMADVDKLGFLKDDLLGLRNLDTLECWARLVGEKMDWHKLSYDEHPEEMWELLDKGLTLGIFQIEDGYARQLSKDMRPRSIDDIGIINAINRPGPIRAGTPDSLIRRKHGEEEVTYDHPILESILNDTYGHFVYQEQIMKFFAAIGYDQGDTDEIRKILGKKKPEVMATVYQGTDEWEGNGYMKMADQAGIEEATARLLWSKIEGFASYSFNKSHAIAYATLGFRTLYAKWRNPHNFMIALIKTNPDDAGKYVSEGRRMGVPVKPPHILKSGWDIEVVDGDIYFGFSNIKGVGKGAGEYIVSLRDRYGCDSADALRGALELEQTEWEDNGKMGRSPRQRLGINKVDLLEQTGAFDDYIDRNLTLPQIQKLESELLQVVLTDNNDEIFTAHSEELARCGSYSDLKQEGKVDIPGIIASVVEKRTKKANKKMGIVTVEYEGDDAEFVVFPNEWSNYRFLWKERTPAIFTLTVTERGTHFDKGLRLS